MRLKKVEHGQRLPQKLILGIMALTMRDKAPDIMRVVFYRPELFGKSVSVYTHEVLRGPSEWSIGERELLAAFVSRKNQCSF